MINSNLKASLTSLFDKRVLFDTPMSLYTYFKIGGNADCLVMPSSIDEVLSVLKLCKSYNTPVTIIGNGTNVLVGDNGIDGVVVQIGEHFSEFSVNDTLIKAQGGILLSKLAMQAYRLGLSGLEFAAGIPGSLGGGVYMNAGAYGGQLSDVVIKTKYITMDGELKTAEGSEHQFGYRNSIFCHNQGIVLECELELVHGNQEEMHSKMQEFARARREKQPLSLPSAGSVFKRPEGMFAGALIEGCGLKGCCIGGAQVSELHAGFIVNTGGASANDVVSLIEHIKEQVLKNCGVELHCEIKMVGKF